MSDLLAGSPVPRGDITKNLLDALRVDARRALRDNVIVRSGDYVICPDVMVLEWIANGGTDPDTTAVGWPQGDSEMLAGRLCLLFRAEPPGPGRAKR